MNIKTTAMTTAAVLTLSATIAMTQTTPQGGTQQPRPAPPDQTATSPGTAPSAQTPAGDRRDASASNAKSMDAQTFMREAALDGMAEVELGHLALGKASSGPSGSSRSGWSPTTVRPMPN
jgi:hypothetical protein